eukprot:COSAG05_NODE_4739_length_1389_cov_2.479070_2_plen_142_part_00
MRAVAPVRPDLFIPYCTGDVHIGNGEIESLGLRFNGANNTRAALEWVYEQVPAPESVLTVGCSAGSLGATVFSRWVADHYRSALCVSSVIITAPPDRAHSLASFTPPADRLAACRRDRCYLGLARRQLCGRDERRVVALTR